MDGEDGDGELLTGAGSRTRPQKRQRAELQAAGSTHPRPFADAPGACDEAGAEVTVLRRLVSLKLVQPRMWSGAMTSRGKNASYRSSTFWLHFVSSFGLARRLN